MTRAAEGREVRSLHSRALRALRQAQISKKIALNQPLHTKKGDKAPNRRTRAQPRNRDTTQEQQGRPRNKAQRHTTKNHNGATPQRKPHQKTTHQEKDDKQTERTKTQHQKTKTPKPQPRPKKNETTDADTRKKHPQQPHKPEQNQQTEQTNHAQENQPPEHKTKKKKQTRANPQKKHNNTYQVAATAQA